MISASRCYLRDRSFTCALVCTFLRWSSNSVTYNPIGLYLLSSISLVLCLYTHYILTFLVCQHLFQIFFIFFSICLSFCLSQQFCICKSILLYLYSVFFIVIELSERYTALRLTADQNRINDISDRFESNCFYSYRSEYRYGRTDRQSADIDSVALSDTDNGMVVGECKFRNGDPFVYDVLSRRSKAIPTRFRIVL